MSPKALGSSLQFSISVLAFTDGSDIIHHSSDRGAFSIPLQLDVTHWVPAYAVTRMTEAVARFQSKSLT